MSAPLRLVIFDVDGTLVDHHSDVLAAMRGTVLGIVGLSSDVAVARLA